MRNLETTIPKRSLSESLNMKLLAEGKKKKALGSREVKQLEERLQANNMKKKNKGEIRTMIPEEIEIIVKQKTEIEKKKKQKKSNLYFSGRAKGMYIHKI